LRDLAIPGIAQYMTKKNVSEDTLADLLELIYPIQYKWGFALEDVLRSDALTRMQVTILWLLRCEGTADHSMRRRDLQQFLVAWFEASNSTITKALTSMARSPLKLVRVLPDPRSGREKYVILTLKGEQFFLAMLQRCREFLKPIAAEIGEQDIREGIRYLKKWLAVAEVRSIEVLPKNQLTSANQKKSASLMAVKPTRARPSRRMIASPQSYNHQESSRSVERARERISS
jgi:DNA-binding MarR family transcriptional regulator